MGGDDGTCFLLPQLVLQPKGFSQTPQKHLGVVTCRGGGTARVVTDRSWCRRAPLCRSCRRASDPASAPPLRGRGACGSALCGQAPGRSGAAAGWLRKPPSRCLGTKALGSLCWLRRGLSCLNERSSPAAPGGSSAPSGFHVVPSTVK